MNRNKISRKYIFLVMAVGLLMVSKNLYLLTIGQIELQDLKAEKKHEEAINYDKREEIKTLNSKDYIMRYAVRYLNLIPSEDIKSGDKDAK